MKENEILLRKLQGRLEKEFKYMEENSTTLINFYNQGLEKDKWGYTIFNGYILDLEEVYRHNGTEENKSCYLDIIKWNNNSGKRVARFKVSCKYSDRRIEKEVLKALDEYNKLVKEEE